MPPKRKAAARSSQSNEETVEGEPEVKTSKVPDVAATTDEEYSISWTVPNVRGLNDNGVNSPVHTHKGVPWYIRARTETSDRTNNVKTLSVYLYCDEKNPSGVWYVDTVATFTLRSANKNSLNEKFTYRFTSGSNNSGYASLLSWTDLVNPLSGYVNSNNEMTVEVVFSIVALRGLKAARPLSDFSSPVEGLSDVVLVVEGRELHVGKQYLALHSPVFHALFFHGFKESKEDRIPLEGVNYEEFIELLHVLYPSEKPINDKTCPALLRLADQFQIQRVLNQTESFLSSTNLMPISTRLRYADQYNLYDAQDACLKQLKTASDIKTVKNQRDYIFLSDALKLMIAEKLLKMKAE